MHSILNQIGLVAICLAVAGIFYARSIRAARAASAKPPPGSVPINEDTTLPSDFAHWLYMHHSEALRVTEEDRPVVESFPNIYVPPAEYANYLHSGVLPEGTIAFRQFELANLPGTSASALAGRQCRICFSPDRAHTADVRIKDTKRFRDTDGWGYFQFDLSQVDNPI
jgi:Cytochrome P460